MITSPSNFCAIDFFKIIIIIATILLWASNSLAEGNNTDVNLKIGPLLQREISKEKPEQNLLESYDAGEQTNTEEAENIIKVIVVIDTNYLQPLPEDILRKLTEKVRLLGGHVGNHAFNNVQVWIPIEKVKELASWTKIKLIKKPTLPKPNDIVTGGLNFIGAGEWHTGGVTGEGVKVGIIDLGFAGYSSLLGTELPATVEVAHTGEISDFFSMVHGTACAEIIHDVAPDADLFLINAADMEVAFPLAVKWLKSKGVDVISSSMGLNLKIRTKMLYYLLNGNTYSMTYANRFLENLEQTKAQMNYMVSIVVASGVTWSQAAGNDGQKKWSGWFTDNDNDGFLNFSSHDNYNKIDTRGIVNENIYVLLMWDFDDGLTYDDYNLYIVDQYRNIVDRSIINQWYIPIGIEACKFTVQPGKEYYAFVKKYNADDQSLVLLVGHSQFPSLKYHDAYGTINLSCPAGNFDAITVGAVHRTNSPPYVTIADYSSQGPVDGMIKPDIVAPAGVRTASYESSFRGTSAAAPHVAGICALVKQKYPAFTPAQIKNYLASNAVDLGAPGKDNVYGSGLVHLPEMTYADLVPYKPDGWSDKLIISSTQGNNADNDVLTEEDNLYVDWSILNNSETNITGTFTTSLFLDNVLLYTWTTNGLPAGYYTHVEDYNIGKLGAGVHSIKINTDTENSIFESNETNNSYVKNFTVVRQQLFCSPDHLENCDQQGCEAFGDGYWWYNGVCRAGSWEMNYNGHIAEAPVRLGDDADDGVITVDEGLSIVVDLPAGGRTYALLVFPNDLGFYFIDSTYIINDHVVPLVSNGETAVFADLCTVLQEVPELKGAWGVYILTVPSVVAEFLTLYDIVTYLNDGGCYSFGSYSVIVDCH